MNRRLLTLLSPAVLVTGWTVLAFTCEDKATTAQTAVAKPAVRTAEATHGCTAEPCKAKGASAAHACAGKTTAVTASSGYNCGSKKASAVTASAEGSHGCGAHKSAAMAVEQSGCSHGNSASKSAAKNSSACTWGGAAMAGFSRVDAVVAGGPGCSSHGATAFGHKHSCDACADMAQYDSEIQAVGGQTQMVRLKNGVMFVHTADSPSHVRAVQAAMMRRNDRLVALTSAGDKVKLCAECKAMRGAMASGKLNREIVTIEGGCLTLMTSNDRSIVAKLHAIAGNEMARKS
jgi:hypothetical protein